MTCFHRTGITPGSEDDADGPVVGERDIDGCVVEAAGGGGHQQGRQRGLDERKDHLRFGVAEPHIEFDDPRPQGRQHEAGIEEPPERVPFGHHALQHRQDDVVLDARLQRRVDQGARGEGPHAAGVRPLVVVVDALVVLGGQQPAEGAAIGDHEARHFGAREALLEHDTAAGVTKGGVDHRGVDGGFRSGLVRGHDHALAGGESIGLDDHGRAEPSAADDLDGLVGGVAGHMTGGRHVVAFHEGLGEGLAGLEPGSGGGGSEDGMAGLEAPVDESGGQRRFRPDDGQVDAVGVDEGQHLVGSGGRDGGHGHMAGEAGVAGGTQDGRDLRITLEPPGQGVFASTASKDENAHDSCRERLW